jgi:predicted phage-related endonuclease
MKTIIGLKQGSAEWKAARAGKCTGSRFKDARDRLKSGKPSAKCELYAKDTARERCGGAVMDIYQNAAMRFGSEQEDLARKAYEARTGNMVFEVGFITDDDGCFGLSPDGIIDDDGVLEIKTMVSSDTLFKAVVEGDISEYIDQINGYMWLMGRKWVDLVLWAPDLKHLGLELTIKRIERDETQIEALEADLIAFIRMVEEHEARLRSMAQPANAGQVLEAA